MTIRQALTNLMSLDLLTLVATVMLAIVFYFIGCILVVWITDLYNDRTRRKP